VVVKLGLFNFKSIADLGELELRPLTVLCGPNASGKSSVLQSLLMLSQTFEGPAVDRAPVLLNGPLVRLGSFREVVRGYDLQLPVTLKLEFDVAGHNVEHARPALWAVAAGTALEDEGVASMWDVTSLAFEVTLAAAEHSGPAWQRFPFVSRLATRAAGSDEVYFEMSIERPAPDQVATIRYTLSGDDGPRRNEFSADVTLHRLKPDEVVLAEDLGASYASRRLRFTSPFMVRGSFAFNLRGSDFGQRDMDARALRLSCALIDVIATALGPTLKYVGPLRAEPQSDYPVTSDAADIGPRGENAAQVLAQEYNRPCDRPRLDSDSDDVEQNNSTVLEELQHWFDVMELGRLQAVASETGVELTLTSSATGSVPVSLAGTGFGVSQLLPILLQGLRMQPQDTLLLEQPEIHLHPKLQMQVADFLISLAKIDRSVVVETHSDHVVSRVVRRIVEGQLSPEDAAIYFAHNDEHGTRFERVEVDDVFGIVNWPEGFFDQDADEQEAILRASLRRRADTGRN